MNEWRMWRIERKEEPIDDMVLLSETSFSPPLKKNKKQGRQPYNWLIATGIANGK